MPDLPELSIVLPMYNESAGARDCVARIEAALVDIGRSYEIVCVDDGSGDGTGALLDDMAVSDPALLVVHLSRNFGKEAALTAGLEAASGAAVILMDADLQHPPTLLATLVQQWDAGQDVVEAVKRRRGHERLPYRVAAWVFYSLMGRAVGGSMQGSSDFKLLDRQVVDALLACKERARFLRGLVAWVGFRVARVPFDVQPRASGASAWSTWGLIRYSARNLVAFSTVPLHVVAWLGAITTLLGAGLAVQTLWRWMSGQAVSGFTTVILLDLLLGGAILLALGVLAVYLARIADEQKARPLYLVRAPRRPRVAAVTPEAGRGPEARDRA